MKNKKVVLCLMVLFVISALGLAFAQEKKPAGPPQVVTDIVSKAKAAIKTVPAAQVKAVAEKKDKAILLDVRDPGEFAAGHFPGAINVSRGLLEWRIWTAVPDQNAKVIVYCKTGGRAALATKTLSDLGYKGAVLSEIHYEDWVKAGNQVER